MQGEGISKIQIEQYQKRKEKAILIENIRSLEEDITKVKNQNDVLRRNITQEATPEMQKASSVYEETGELWLISYEQLLNDKLIISPIL